MRILLLMLLAACGRHHTIEYGEAKLQQLLALKGEPLEEKAIPVKDGKILVYPNNEKYQLDGEVVSSGFKDPAGDQRLVLFWKHRFRDCNTEIKQLPSKDAHLPPEIELACPEQGRSVIYTQDSEFITRIVEYAKR
jgi:hypothetical protein